jgi:hypothetical protein
VDDVAPIVSADGVRRACAIDPCSLVGTCLNGGTCAAGVRQGAAGAFTCNCLAEYGGPRCVSAGGGH